MTKLAPGELVLMLGDTHVYENHVAALDEQLTRSPKPFPTIEIPERESIDAFSMEDFVLKDYDPMPAIPMKMAV